MPNLPEIMANRGCSKYEAFASHVERDKKVIELEQYDYCQPWCTLDAEATNEPDQIPNVVSDDSDDPKSVFSELNELDEQQQRENAEVTEAPIVENIQDFMQFNDEDHRETVEIEENQDVFASTDAGELLRYHYRFVPR